MAIKEKKKTRQGFFKGHDDLVFGLIKCSIA